MSGSGEAKDIRLAFLARLSGEIFTKTKSLREILIERVLSDVKSKLRRYKIKAKLSLLNNRILIDPSGGNLKNLAKVLISTPGIGSIAPVIKWSGFTTTDLTSLRKLILRIIRYYRPHLLKIFWERLPKDPQLKERAITLKGELLEKSLKELRPPSNYSARELDIRMEYYEGDLLFIIFRAQELRGPAGLPLSDERNVVGVLLSEGPDSLLAAWMLARRGLRTVLVHFSPSQEVSREVLESASLIKLVQPSSKLIVVSPWGEVLRVLAQRGRKREICFRCKASMKALAWDILRELFPRSTHIAIATGEIIGEQASQTFPAFISTTPKGVPFLTPLAGFSKEEVYQYLQRAGFYEAVVRRPSKRCPFAPEKPRTVPSSSPEKLDLKSARELIRGLKIVHYPPEDLPNPLELIELPSDEFITMSALLSGILQATSSYLEA